jgi:hypothetical protein
MTAFSRIESGDRPEVATASRARAPRVSVEAGARLRVGAHLLIVRTLDISRGGAKLALADCGQRALLSRGALVLLNVDCLPTPRLAAVSWLRGDRLGLCFQEPLKECELAGLRSGR